MGVLEQSREPEERFAMPVAFAHQQIPMAYLLEWIHQKECTTFAYLQEYFAECLVRLVLENRRENDSDTVVGSLDIDSLFIPIVDLH